MRILVILPRFPFPLEKGDKLRAYNQIKVLAQRHEVHLCALNEGPVQPEWMTELEQFCRSVYVIPFSKAELLLNLVMGFVDGLPLQVAYFYDQRMVAIVRELKETVQPDMVYCQLARTAEYAKHLRGVPKAIDFQDAFATGAERLMHNGNWLLRPLYALEYKRMARYEQEIFSQFNAHTVISEQDRDLLQIQQRNAVHIVRNGVDTEHYSPRTTATDAHVVFAGNMGYAPNVKASMVLAKEVMPLVRRAIPDAKLLLAGARPAAQVKALAGPLTEVTGFVPDLRDQYARAQVFVAPMQIGTGLQNKLLEAMSMGIPCVTTTLANNAIGAKNDVEVLLGDQITELAAATIKLLNDRALAQQIGQAGMQLVHHRYGWEAATAPLEALLRGAAERK